MDSRTVAGKLGQELKRYAVIAAYLYVCFGALILYKAAILRGQGISYTPYGLAVFKALVLAKFMLMGHAAKIGEHYARRRFVHVVAYKSLLFLALLFVLSIGEEVVVGLIHGRRLVDSLAVVTGGSMLQTIASCIIMLLILIPYLGIRELNQVLGEGRLRQIIFEHRAGLRAGGR
jgi:phosphatidylserine synthase